MVVGVVVVGVVVVYTELALPLRIQNLTYSGGGGRRRRLVAISSVR